jgi:hypothetical protein
MIPNQSDENGEDLCFRLVIPRSEIGGGRRRNSTASIVVKPLDADQQVRFDADVQALLAELIRQERQIKGSEHVAQ